MTTTTKKRRKVEQTAQKALIASMVADVEAGIRVLNTRGAAISESEITERARNIVAGLIGNYTIKAVPAAKPIVGPGPCPTGHQGPQGTAGAP